MFYIPFHCFFFYAFNGTSTFHPIILTQSDCGIGTLWYGVEFIRKCVLKPNLIRRDHLDCIENDSEIQNLIKLLVIKTLMPQSQQNGNPVERN